MHILVKETSTNKYVVVNEIVVSFYCVEMAPLVFQLGAHYTKLLSIRLFIILYVSSGFVSYKKF